MAVAELGRDSPEPGDHHCEERDCQDPWQQAHQQAHPVVKKLIFIGKIRLYSN